MPKNAGNEGLIHSGHGQRRPQFGKSERPLNTPSGVRNVGPGRSVLQPIGPPLTSLH
jgi:hypothetical protein